jgi:NDP-sugar pyrophosphorylase family protein
VLLGPGVRVGAGATIVGPTSLGPNTTVGRGALVSRTVSWNDCVIQDEALVDGCVLADHVTVTAGRPVFRAVRVRELRPRRDLPAWMRLRHQPEKMSQNIPIPSTH